MSDIKITKEEREIIFRNYDRKNILMFVIIFLICVSLPGNVKCDMGDAISSLILFVLVAVFIFAGIGWWSRRGDSKGTY